MNVFGWQKMNRILLSLYIYILIHEKVHIFLLNIIQLNNL